MYYHFVRYHESLKVEIGTGGDQQREAAAAALQASNASDGGRAGIKALDGKGVIEYPLAVDLLEAGG